MVEEWDSPTTAAYLEITVNHLRQIQHRGQLKWKSRNWRSVYYDPAEVKAYRETRDQRKTR
jgi:hypothetical protein